MMSTTVTQTAEILLVEDNDADARLTMEALRDNEPYGNLHAVQNGQQALAWLRQEGEYGEAPRPDIILLDLNMPAKDGRQTLAEIKQQYAPNAVRVRAPYVPSDVPGVVEVEPDDGAFNLALGEGVGPQEVLRALLDRGVEVLAFEVAPVPLEDIFVAAVRGEEG